MKQEQEIRVLPSSTYENNIDGTAAGQLAASIYGAFNQYLSDSYSEKQRDRSRLYARRAGDLRTSNRR